MLDEVLNPSGDRISVLRSQIKTGSKITVRTITVDGEMSIDSGVARPYSECTSATSPKPNKMNLSHINAPAHHSMVNHKPQRMVSNADPMSVQGNSSEIN